MFVAAVVQHHRSHCHIAHRVAQLARSHVHGRQSGHDTMCDQCGRDVVEVGMVGSLYPVESDVTHLAH